MDPSTEVLNAVTEVNPCTAARGTPEWANARKQANTSLMTMPVQQLFEKAVCAGNLPDLISESFKFVQTSLAGSEPTGKKCSAVTAERLKEVTDDKRSGACFGISLDQVNLKETAHTFVSPKRIEYAINKWNYMAPGVGSIIELVQLNLDSWSGSEVAKLERLNQDAEILAALNVMFYSNHLLTDNILSGILTFLPSG